MAAVIPKGFEIIPAPDEQPVPDNRLPEAWQPPEQEDDDLEYSEDGSLVIAAPMETPEGFEPLPTDLPYGEGEQGEVGDSSVLLEDEQVTSPRVGGGEAAWRGLQSNALFGFDDEIAAAGGAAANKVGQWLGMNETEIPISEVYDQLVQQERDRKDAAFDQNQLAYMAGALPGMIISAPFVGGKVAQGATRLRTAGNLAGAGARAGAVSGAGNAEDLGTDMLGEMVEGGTIGAVAAPLAAPIVSGIARGGSAVRDAIMPRNTLNSGLEVLARTAPQDAAAMRAATREMRAAGVEPRLMDVVDESGRGAIRTAGSRMTPAREELARHADEVYRGAQDRVVEQARRNITRAPNSARALGHQIAEEQRALGPVFDAVRDQPVQITPEMVRAFSTAEARSALRMVGRMLGPEDAARLDDFIRVVQRNGGDPDAAIRQQFPGDWDALPDAVKASIRQQMGIPANPFENSPLTVDIVDKFARVLNDRVAKQPALRNAATQYIDATRVPARQQYAEYDEALTQFANRARAGEAASGTGRFADNTNFLTSPADEFQRGVSSARTEPTVGAETPTISEADAIRMRARDDVVERAVSGQGAQATGVARQLSRGGGATGEGQLARNRILLGEEGADALERGMAAEVRRVDNTRYVDPRTGSQTFSREQDIGEMGADVAMNAASGGKWAAVRAVTQFIRSAGIRGVDAERLVRDAMDPRRTREAILFLEQRGLARDRARSLMRSISSTLGGRLGGAASYERPEQPRSGNEILNRSRRLDNQGAE